MLTLYLKALGSPEDLLKANMLRLLPRTQGSAGDLCKVPVPRLYTQGSAFIVSGQSYNSAFSSISYAELLDKMEDTNVFEFQTNDINFWGTYYPNTPHGPLSRVIAYV